MSTRDVEGQLDAARAAAVLLGVNTETHPRAQFTAPATAADAYERAAYWLAVAARPRSQGAPTDGGLFNSATQNLAAYHAESWVPNPVENTAGRVYSILADAERTLARAGRSDVAAVLGGMRGGAVGSPQMTLTRYAAGGTALIAVVGVGFLAYLTAPLWLRRRT